MPSWWTRGIFVLGLPAFAVLLGAHSQTVVQPADAILLNAKIYTVNARQPWAQALAIRGEKIVAVGSAREIEPYHGAATRVIDARGHLVLPGFTDCHIHFLEGSLDLSRVELSGATTVAEIQKRLREYAAAHPSAPWILGQGWTYDVFGTVALPHKKFIDEVIPGHPVFSKASTATRPGRTARRSNAQGSLATHRTHRMEPLFVIPRPASPRAR